MGLLGQPSYMYIIWVYTKVSMFCPPEGETMLINLGNLTYLWVGEHEHSKHKQKHFVYCEGQGKEQSFELHCVGYCPLGLVLITEQ